MDPTSLNPVAQAGKEAFSTEALGGHQRHPTASLSNPSFFSPERHRTLAYKTPESFCLLQLLSLEPSEQLFLIGLH